MKKRITILGGGGYVGSALVELLLNNSYHVTVLDRFFFGTSPLNDLLHNPNLTIKKGDIRNKATVENVCRDAEGVVLLAGLVGDPACAVNPRITREINIDATKTVIDAVNHHAVQRFIFISSCSVYGASNNIVDESSPLNPVSLYAETKIESEKRILGATGPLYNPIIFRLATVFGNSRRPRFDLIINLFTAQAYESGILNVTGGTQYRPFIHVRDVARGILLGLQAPVNKISKQIINLGDDALNSTILKIADEVRNVIPLTKKGAPVRINTIEGSADRRDYHVSFGKIQRMWKFKTEINIREGIKEMYRSLVNKQYPHSYKYRKYSNIKQTQFLIERNKL